MSAPLLGRTAFERLAGAALDLDDADVEVFVQRDAGGLTRFANSQIHQNVWTEDLSVTVRAVTEDGRVGVANAHTDDPAVAAVTAKDALELARVTPPDPDFPGLAPRADVDEVAFDDATGAASPADRADAVRRLLGEVRGDLRAAGSYETRASEVGVFTTQGQGAYAPLSSAELVVVVMGPSSSGYAEAGGRAMGDIDPTAVGAAAVGKARAGADPVEVDAGGWPVVLEPTAVADLVHYLAYIGFGGKDYLEGRSFAARRMGDRVADRKVSLFDDALSPATIGLPFDFEGTPKRRVELIRDGVCRSVVWDRHTAKAAGTQSTGHALPAGNTLGPLPLNPLLEPGDDGTVDDLAAGLERGLLVTRLHYVNPVHRTQTLITGMTRDGTFLVEDGRVTRGVRNLRFTQSILKALSSVEAISAETRYASGVLGGGRYPGVRLGSFSFTGTTSFG